MTFIAEVHVAHPDLALSGALRTASGVAIEREYQTGVDPAQRYAFYSVRGDDRDAFESFEAALADDDTVADSLVVADTGGRRLYRVRLSEDAMLLEPKLASLGIAVLEASCASGAWQLVLRVPDRDRLAEFNDYCKGADVDFRVDRLSTDDVDDGPAQPSSLTDAQREALVAAYRNGFFEEPRGTSLEELADELGISSTAVGGRIRRGTGKLVDAVLLSDDPATGSGDNT